MSSKNNEGNKGAKKSKPKKEDKKEAVKLPEIGENDLRFTYMIKLESNEEVIIDVNSVMKFSQAIKPYSIGNLNEQFEQLFNLLVKEPSMNDLEEFVEKQESKAVLVVTPEAETAASNAQEAEKVVEAETVHEPESEEGGDKE